MRRKQHGAVLVFFVLLLLPLIAMIGLAVDTGLVLSSKNQLTYMSQSAALAAISKYITNLNNDQACTQSGTSSTTNIKVCAMDLALQAAEKAARAHLSASDIMLNHVNKIQELGLATGSSTVTSVTGTNGKFEVGRYYWENPNPSNSPSVVDECSGAQVSNAVCGTNPYPCFVPRQVQCSDNNAVRVTMKTDDNNPLQTFFFKILGYNKVGISSEAIATLIPRNDIFLLDLSTSMYRDNYLENDFGALGEGAADFAYELGTDRNGSQITCNNPTNPPYSHVGPTTNSNGNSCDLNLNWGNNGSIYTWVSDVCPVYAPGIDVHLRATHRLSRMNTTASPYAGLPSTYAHYINQYRCRTITFDPSEGARRFFIDYGMTSAYNSGQPVDSRPEPLSSALDALNIGLVILDNRKLSTDRVGITGFDEVMDPIRKLTLTSPDLTKAAVRAFYDATNVTANFTGGGDNPDDSFITKGFFPRAKNTNIQAALLDAMDQIANQPTSKDAKNSVVLITDGLHNCPSMPVSEGYYDSTPALFGLPGTHYGVPSTFNATQPCVNSGSNAIFSLMLMNEDLSSPTPSKKIYKFVDEFVTRKIAINIALLGSGAHYLVKKSINPNSSQCQSQAESHVNDRQWVDYSPPTGVVPGNDYFAVAPGSFATNDAWKVALDASMASTFYAPNVLYDNLVKPTNGLWIPILPRVEDAAGNGVAFVEELDAGCSSLGTEDELLVSHAVSGGYYLDASGNKIATTIASGPTNVTDSNGRILYDPFGRTPAQQMMEAMNSILQSPYLLAEP